MIELQHITQRYRTPEGRDFFALNDVSLSIKSGEIFGIIGRSGAGKSTLVRCINFLNRPTEGTVTVDGKCLNTMTNAELRAARRQIAMIFQHLTFSPRARSTTMPRFRWNLRAGTRPRSAKRWSRFLTSWAWRITATSTPRSSRAAKSSAWALPERLPLTPRSF